MIGIVTQKNADLFTVQNNEQVFLLKSKGTLKKDGVFVGDKVQFNQEVIEKVLPRKNCLIRPPIANVKKMFIVIAPLPKPDFLLVDKMILCCRVKGITPIVVVNKNDIIEKNFEQFVKKTYKKVAKVLFVCAKQKKIEALLKEIVGVCAFAGQSAVGKSSLINAIFNDNKSEVGILSKKTQRGKQTTRLVSLYKTERGYIADTAGFSSLQVEMLVDLMPQDIDKFYPDFLPYLQNCKYRTCNHKDGQCGILQALSEDKISLNRYQNYLKIFDSLVSFKQKYK